MNLFDLYAVRTVCMDYTIHLLNNLDNLFAKLGITMTTKLCHISIILSEACLKHLVTTYLNNEYREQEIKNQGTLYQSVKVPTNKYS